MGNAHASQDAVDGETRHWRIGLVASPSLRRGPASPLAQLLREIEPCLRYLNAEIFAVEGALHTIIRCGLLRTLDPRNIHGMPSGRLGGLVDIGAAVVERRVAGVGRVFGDAAKAVSDRLGFDTKVDAVIYLLDPYDPTARLPETLALKRECVVKGKPFLATAASVREWFSLHAVTAAAESGAPPSAQLRRAFIDEKEAKRIGLAPRGHQTVALIAHNQCKLKLTEFATEHRDFLMGFDHRFGTGTSAGVLNRVCGEGDPCPGSEAEMDALVKIVRATRRAGNHVARRDDPSSSDSDHWAEELDSGPEGGDLQAAEAILMGVCDTAVFFEDPTSAHEHDADIEVFERAARVGNLPERRLDGWGVTCMHDSKSASEWARMWMAHGHTPTTMAHVFRARYGVELVMVDPPGGGEPEAAWAAVVIEAAWYMLSAVMAAGWSRAPSTEPDTGTAQQLRVVVPPGRGMNDVIREMKQLFDAPQLNTQARNNELDRALKDVRKMLRGKPNADRMIGLAMSSLNRKRLRDRWRAEVLSDRLVVAPATGTFGSPVRGIEANVHATELAEIFGARSIACAPTAFTTAPTSR
jgi:methylglyoxal synthase